MNKTPVLTRIPHARGKAESAHIKRGKDYLCRIRRGWFAGRFSREWYGWNFENWGATGIGLEAISEVYLIEVPDSAAGGPTGCR